MADNNDETLAMAPRGIDDPATPVAVPGIEDTDDRPQLFGDVSGPEPGAPDVGDVEAIGQPSSQGPRSRSRDRVMESKQATGGSREKVMGPPVEPHTMQVDDEVSFRVTKHTQPALLPTTIPHTQPNITSNPPLNTTQARQYNQTYTHYRPQNEPYQHSHYACTFGTEL